MTTYPDWVGFYTDADLNRFANEASKELDLRLKERRKRVPRRVPKDARHSDIDWAEWARYWSAWSIEQLERMRFEIDTAIDDKKRDKEEQDKRVAHAWAFNAETRANAKRRADARRSDEELKALLARQAKEKAQAATQAALNKEWSASIIESIKAHAQAEAKRQELMDRADKLAKADPGILQAEYRQANYERFVALRVGGWDPAQESYESYVERLNPSAVRHKADAREAEAKRVAAVRDFKAERQELMDRVTKANAAVDAHVKRCQGWDQSAVRHMADARLAEAKRLDLMDRADALAKTQASVDAHVQFSYTGAPGDITWFYFPREPRRVSLSHWGLHEI